VQYKPLPDDVDQEVKVRLATAEEGSFYGSQIRLNLQQHRAL